MNCNFRATLRFLWINKCFDLKHRDKMEDDILDQRFENRRLEGDVKELKRDMDKLKSKFNKI